MTTTPNPTAEQIIEEVLHPFPERVWLSHRIVARLRAVGLLGGDPTEEQIELAAAAEAEGRWWNGGYKSRYRDQSPAKSWQNGFIDGAKWAAAGVAPQADAKSIDMSTEHANKSPDSSSVVTYGPTIGNGEVMSDTKRWRESIEKRLFRDRPENLAHG